MRKPVVLRVYKGDELLQVKQFLEPQIVIGRGPEVQVELSGEAVSLIHAVLEERDSGHYYLCDLGSESGTLRNGKKILDAKIEPGDFIQIGDYRLEFFVGVPKPKAPPPSVSELTSIEITHLTSVKPSGSSEPAVPSGSNVSGEPAVPSGPPASSAPFEPVTVPTSPSSPSTQVKSSSSSETPTKPTETHPASVKPQALSSGPQILPVPQVPSSSLTPPLGSAPVPVGQQTPPAQGSTLGARPSGGLAGPGGISGLGGSIGGGGGLQKFPGVSSGRRDSKKFKTKSTFAPKSHYNNVREFIKPSKGTVVEVLVAWRERVIATHHFSEKKIITMGSHPDNDISLPLFVTKIRKLPILKIDTHAVVMVTPEMTGELIRGQASSTFSELMRQNRMVKNGASYSLILEQGEMLRLDLNDQVAVIVRYVSDSPKPLVAPLFDLTTSEVTGVVLSVVLVSILGLYMFLYTPPKVLLENGNDEPLRTAMIIVAPTPIPRLPPPEAQPNEPPVATPPPQIVKATPVPKKVNLPEKVAAKPMPKAVSQPRRTSPGRAAKVAPSQNKGPRAHTAVKQGGAIKTADKQGSQMKSPPKDVSKSGIFSVFGGKGANDQLAQHTAGSGELSGLANAATGTAGFSENRLGSGLGSQLKDTGRGDTGEALEGIAGGLKTKGRGGGNSGFGTGSLGGRTGVKIVTGGTEESFSGTIDREAIRRVIQSKLAVIRSCYERELNRNPDLFGKLVLAWDIGEHGRVLGTRVKSNDLGSEAVADCVMSRLKVWKFPDPPVNQVVEVAYPFFFSN